MSNCACNSNEVLLFACSGGSNVGQLANAAAIQLTQQGNGRMYCLAGLGGDISGIIESSKSAPIRVAIDGCPVECAKASFRRLGIEPEIALVVTELGIEKQHSFDLPAENVTAICQAVAEKINRQRA